MRIEDGEVWVYSDALTGPKVVRFHVQTIEEYPLDEDLTSVLLARPDDSRYLVTNHLPPGARKLIARARAAK